MTYNVFGGTLNLTLSHICLGLLTYFYHPFYLPKQLSALSFTTSSSKHMISIQTKFSTRRHTRESK